VNDQSPVEAIFFAALEKGIPGERVAYLREACVGNETLRTRVETLLAAHSQIGQFLERPIAEAEGVAALGNAEHHATDLSFLARSDEPGSLGRLDHFEILEVVGRGGMGVVLRARDTKLGRIVAIKALATPLATSTSARRRFVREARAAAAVRDDHVVAIHAVHEDAPIPYLVMEFIDGGSLEKLLRHGALEVEQVLRIGIQVARGLAAAHQQGLIHRDVKPQNILIENRTQRVKLTDFGLARAVDDASLTHAGFVAGTPLYMAPEQAANQPIDHRTDLFSLGSVLYEMCAGRPAFSASTTVAVIRRVCDDAPRPIREVNPNIPESLCRLIDRLHAKESTDRPGSAQDVADQLTSLQDGSAVRTAPILQRPRQRTARRLAALAAMVLLCLGLGLGEAGGVIDLRGTMVRLFSSQGTLVVEIDDPDVSVAVDGTDMVVTGAGAKEIRLKPGQYKVEASKEGKHRTPGVGQHHPQ
jgi:serine/threonine protein kinase